MPKFLALFLAALSLTVVAGCSSGPSLPGTRSGLFGGSGETAEGEQSTFYAGSAGASVFSKASAESRLLGKLDPHERVTKTGEAKGFAHIRARGGSMVGWVHNSKLVRRRPSQPPTRPGGSATTGVSPKADAPNAATTEPQSSTSDDAHPDAGSAAESSEVSANASSVDVSRQATTAAPAAEPTGPDKPRGVGASVFDPY